jgi:myosin heavy subunit
MSLKDRFRIDELTKVGSKTITRDDSGGITVRRINKKEINPISFELPQPKKSVPITKSDTVNPTKDVNPQQESFSGETSTYIERPFYNEEELQKAVDLKVDELIKKKKPKRGEYVRKQLLTDALDEIQRLNKLIGDEKRKLAQKESEIQSLQSQLQSAITQRESAEQELQIKDETLQNLIAKYEQAVADIQTTIIKATKEAIERASLNGQVKGLQAQKTTLTAQLNAQKGINETLQTQIEQQAVSFEGILTSLNAQAENLQATIQNQATEIAATQQSLAQAQAAASAAQAESASKGKKIICNELYRQGYLTEDIWIADEKFGDWLWETNRKTAIGYTIWARQVVNFMQKKPQYTKYIYKFLKPWTQQMAYQMGVVEKTHMMGWLTMKIGWWFSNLIYTIYGNKFEEVLTRLNRIK